MNDIYSVLLVLIFFLGMFMVGVLITLIQISGLFKQLKSSIDNIAWNFSHLNQENGKQANEKMIVNEIKKLVK